MVFDGQMMDAGKFRKQLLSLSQGDLCGDCLAVVLNELDDAPKIDVMANKQPSVCFRHKNKDGVIMASCVQENILWENLLDGSDLIYLDMEDNDVKNVVDMLHELCR